MSLTKKDRMNSVYFRNNFSARRASPTRSPPRLRREYGATHAAVKTVVSLTGANERAVKNWFDAKNAPSGEFLVALCRHSDEVLETFLLMAGRMEHVKAKKIVDATNKLREILVLLDALQEGAERCPSIERRQCRNTFVRCHRR